MQTSYIYSVSRVNALSQFLLNKTDIERLLVAEPGEDLQSALKETYLAPYVVHVPDESIPLAIEMTLIEAKRLIQRLAPRGDVFKIMWIQYDIHNLRVLAKAKTKDIPFSECRPLMSERGVYTPEYLYEQVENNNLDSLQPEWQAGFMAALDSADDGDIGQIDIIFDRLYFKTGQRIVDKGKDDFMRCYFRVLIDLYNLKSRLRALKNPGVALAENFIPGGSFRRDQIETKEELKERFYSLGGEHFWREAIEFHEETGHFSQVETKAAEYLLTVAKEGSRDMFSAASLVLYYLKCRQAAANIRNIVVGKNSGLPVEVIRRNLRMAYVND